MRKYEWLDKAEFDRLCDDNQFAEGPYMDGFGSGYGEPYRPKRRIFGTLKDGRNVESNTQNERPKHAD